MADVPQVWDANYLGVMFQVEDHYVKALGTAFQDMVHLATLTMFS